MSDLVLALDIGGTKVAAGLVDSDGVLRHSAVQQMPKPGVAGDGSAEGPWRAVSAAIDEVLAAASGPVSGVGVGCAGPVNTVEGAVSPINIPAWQGFALVDRLRAKVPGVPIRLAGDVVCLALGEQWRGAGQGSRYLLGLVVSTGVGGGLVLDGRPYGGRTGNAGHVGHVVVEPDGHPCTCGGLGCVETVASGRHLVRWAAEQGWTAPAGSDAARLAEDARRGDPVAVAAFRRAGVAVGLAITATAVVCDLDLVVIGGGVSQVGALLFDPIRETLRRHLRLSFVDGLRVVPAELGAAAGLIGAAALLAP